MRRVAVNDDVHRTVEDLLLRHRLRGADTIHLASAVLIRNIMKDSVTFVAGSSGQSRVDTAFFTRTPIAAWYNW